MIETANNVLIASSTPDVATYGPVARKLTDHGRKVIVFEADRVASGSVLFDLRIANESGVDITYSDELIALESIKAAWYRRADHIYSTNSTKYLAIDSERANLQNGLWNLIADDYWLNAPRLMPAASKKLAQLNAAIKAGFSVPETVVTNHWQPIIDNLPENIIYKASNPLFYNDEQVLTLFTTPFHNSAEKLPKTKNPYPGIWQERLSKFREWRITVVGDETFDAAIYTHETAKDDWRRHQLDPGRVEFRKDKFPDEMREKCIKYLGFFGLKFGAFDFVEDEQGKISFLECNPNGQFMWLEHALDFKISDAITAELLRMSATN